MADQGPLSGQSLGGNKYQLGQRLGKGGFAEVYQAENLLLHRQQAIKVLLEHHVNDPKFSERFEREAQMLADLDHLNIVAVHDFGYEDLGAQGKRGYLVMPLLSGGTFQDALNQIPIPSLQETLRYLEQICAALMYAHGKNVVHLDLKPLNILLHQDGRLLLSDFGLAHLMKRGVVQGGSSLALGTVAYMAPEHLLGQPDWRSDLYALGVMLYQMLIGRLPFDGPTPEAIALKQMMEPAPLLRAARPDLSVALEQVVSKALSKKPVERYQTAKEILEAVKAALPRASSYPLPGQPVPTSPPHNTSSVTTIKVTHPPVTPVFSPQPQNIFGQNGGAASQVPTPQASGAPPIPDSSSGTPFPFAGATSDLILRPFSHLTVPLESTLVPTHLSRSGWFIALMAGLAGSGALCLWMIRTPHDAFTWIDWVLWIDTWIALTYFFGSLFTTLWEVGHWWHLPGRNFTHVGGIVFICLFVGGSIGFQISIGTDPAVLLVWIVCAVLLALLWIFFLFVGGVGIFLVLLAPFTIIIIVTAWLGRWVGKEVGIRLWGKRWMERMP